MRRSWKKGIGLLLCALLLAAALPPAASAEAFTDVPEDAWYAPAVEYVRENGLMNGNGDGTFSPEKPLSRAMFVQVLYNMTEHSEKEKENTYIKWLGFSDVDPNLWYGGPVKWAYCAGITEGAGERRFEPNRAVTREQAAVLLYRYAARTENEFSVTDIGDLKVLQASPYARDAVQWAVQYGILQGDRDGSLRPKDPVTRAEAAQMLKKAAPLLEKRVVQPFARASGEAEAWGLTTENYPRVDGSTSTLKLVQDAFWQMHESWNEIAWPETASRTVPSYEKLIAGKADLILVPYASADVLAQAKAAGVELEFHKLALEALVFITCKDNSTENITKEQAVSIYRDYGIRNWRELGGPDQELIPLCRNANSGSQSQIDNLILNGQAMHPDIEKNYTEWTMPSMLYQVANYHKDNEAVDSKNYAALGYTLFAYLENYNDAETGVLSQLKMLSYNGVAPTEESLKDGSYPLTDGYYAVLRRDTPQGAPARKLLAWYQSGDGAHCIQTSGFLPAN